MDYFILFEQKLLKKIYIYHRVGIDLFLFLLNLS
jgi:hypothetical protein